jgi:hypothetical protein
MQGIMPELLLKDLILETIGLLYVPPLFSIYKFLKTMMNRRNEMIAGPAAEDGMDCSTRSMETVR